MNLVVSNLSISDARKNSSMPSNLTVRSIAFRMRPNAWIVALKRMALGMSDLPEKMSADCVSTALSLPKWYLRVYLWYETYFKLSLSLS